MSVKDKGYLFVYGTLRKDTKHTMHRVLTRYAIYVGKGTFQGRLYNLGRYPGAVSSKNKSDRVSGEVFQLRQAGRVFELLDDYEGKLFKREQAIVHLPAGNKLTSWTYLYRGPVKESGRIRNGDYLDFLANR